MDRTLRTRLMLLFSIIAGGTLGLTGCDKKDSPHAAEQPRKVVLKSWDFKDAVPADWSMDEQLVTKARQGGGVEVQMVPNKLSYQLYSEGSIMLTAGSYEVTVDGQVELGAVYLGVENMKTGSFIVSEAFRAATEGQNPRIAVRLHFDTETELGIRFSTAGGATPNTMVIRRVDIVELRY